MSQQEEKVEKIHKRIIRIQTEVLAFVMAIIGGLILWIATAWLLIKGGPNVGEHLQLLKQYLPGYSVSWGGSFLGLLYGFIIGGAVGWAIALIYNRIVDIRNR